MPAMANKKKISKKAEKQKNAMAAMQYFMHGSNAAPLLPLLAPPTGTGHNSYTHLSVEDAEDDGSSSDDQSSESSETRAKQDRGPAACVIRAAALAAAVSSRAKRQLARDKRLCPTKVAADSASRAERRSKKILEETWAAEEQKQKHGKEGAVMVDCNRDGNSWDCNGKGYSATQSVKQPSITGGGGCKCVTSPDGDNCSRTGESCSEQDHLRVAAQFVGVKRSHSIIKGASGRISRRDRSGNEIGQKKAHSISISFDVHRQAEVSDAEAYSGQAPPKKRVLAFFYHADGGESEEDQETLGRRWVAENC